MRKLTVLLLSLLLLLCSIPLTAFAQNSVITTTVPDSHTITVAAGGADVFCDRQPGNLFVVDRLSQPTLLIRAVSGKAITRISLNGEDITDQVKGGFYTLEPIYENKTLTVVTRDAPNPQGKTYTVQGTVLRDGKPVAGATVELRSTLKTTVTDKLGRFSFHNVGCEKHSMTTIENGQIVGYTEFTLTEGSAVNLSASEGVYTVTANQNDIGINLSLNLTDNGSIQIATATGISDNGTNPKTGDSFQLLFWQVWMLVVVAGLLRTLAFHRKRHLGK